MIKMSLEKPTVEDFGAFSYDEPIFESWEPNSEDLEKMDEPVQSETQETEQYSKDPIQDSQPEMEHYKKEEDEKEKQRTEQREEDSQNIFQKLGAFLRNAVYMIFQVASDLMHIAIFNTLLGNNERINLTKSINTALIKAQGHVKGEQPKKQEHTKESRSDPKQYQEKTAEQVVAIDGLSFSYTKNSEQVILMDEHGNSLSIPKDDIFTGDTDAVAKKIHEMYDGKNKMECMIQASLAIAKIRLLEGEKGEFSSFTLKTDRGLIETELKIDQMDKLAIVCNGKHVLTEETEEITASKVQESILSFKERDVKFSMGEITVSVGREFTDVYVTSKGEMQRIGCYKFETEQDVTRMIGDLQDNTVAAQSLNEMHITPEAISYVTGIITNPEMEYQRNENGNILNPFTGEAEHDGNAHLFYQQDTGTLMMYEPNEFEKGVQTEIFEVPPILEVTADQYNGMIEAVQTCQLCIKSNVFEVADHHREDEQEKNPEQILQENHFFEESLEEAPQLSNEQIHELFEEECR